MQLGQGALTVIAIAAAAVASLALVLALVLGRRVATLRATAARRSTPRDPGVELTADDISTVLSRAIQRVALVRFDAFEDMGGRLSFAAALLDAEGSGIVLSSINGRSETRIYAKPVERGTSRINLSAEEEEAIRRALSGTRDASGARSAP